MGPVCSCNGKELQEIQSDINNTRKEKDEKVEIQINHTTSTDRKKGGGSDEDILEIKDGPTELKVQEKSQFQIQKEAALDGYKYLPFETKGIGSVTLSSYLLSKKLQTLLKDIIYDFSILLSHIQQSCLQIQERIEKRYILQKCIEDHLTLQNDCCRIFEEGLKSSKLCCVIYCSKRDILLKEDMDSGNLANAKFVVMFSGLDNIIDPENNSGTTFVIWKRVTTKYRPLSERDDILQSCNNIVASGYCMYGQAVQLVLAINSEVNGFAYDPTQKEFILTHPKIKAAQRAGIFSIDCSKEQIWEPHIKIFLSRRLANKHKKQNLRYTGSLVADAHRTLLYGGILLYPLTNPTMDGDISLIDAFALGYIFEKAWGRASQGEGGSIIQMKLYSLQQMTQFFCGSSSEVIELENLYLSIARRQSIITKSIASKFSSNQSIVLNNSLDLSVKSNLSAKDS